MSTIGTSEQALLDVVRLLPRYTEANSSRGDFAIWDAPGSPVGVVVMQTNRSEFGDRIGRRGSMGKRQQQHRISAIVGVKRAQKSDGAAYTELIAAIDELIAHLDAYQRLNDAVQRAEITEVTPVQRKRDSPFIFSAIHIEINTETAPILVETAN